MDNLVDALFEGRPSTLTVEEPELLQIATTSLTQGEASALDRRIDRTAQSLYSDLCQMRDREGWHALGFSSFDKYLRSKSGKIGMDYTTVLRKLQAGDTRTAITQAGVSTKGMADTHARELARLPEEKRAEGWQRAQEIAADYKPVGKAAEHHHVGKVLTSHVEAAVSELLQFATTEEGEERDAFEGDARPDFFSPDNRRRVSEKPLPPEPVTTLPQEQEEPPHSYIFAGLEVFADAPVIFIYGDDGDERAVIPVQIKTIMEAIGK
jgi:hypothetical protein